MIFDLGGGTFDVSLVDINEETFKVLGTAGDNHLGGEDYDTNVLNYCVKEFKERTEIDISKNPKHLRRIRTEVEKAKCVLSAAEDADIEVEDI